MVLRISISVAAAVIPALLLVYFFYRRDVNKEPRSVLIKTFLLGMAITVPVILVELLIHLVPTDVNQPLLFGLTIAFLGAAIPEESFKFLVLTRYCATRPAFDEPMDGIVYGATASLGFATLENILYVSTGGLWTALLRAITAVPAHACFGAIMGYYVGQAKMGRLKGSYKWLGLIFAVLLHGWYDFPLFVERATAITMTPGERMGGIFTILNAIFIGVLIGSILWTLVLVNRVRKTQLLEKVGKERL